MSVDISSAQKGFDGQTPAKPMRVIGSFMPMIPFVVDGAGVSTTSDTGTITFPQLTLIRGWVVDAYVTSSGSKVDDDAITVTVSGNVMTIKENGAGTIELDTYQGIVWGDAKLA
jgi:hypothetical protein